MKVVYIEHLVNQLFWKSGRTVTSKINSTLKEWGGGMTQLKYTSSEIQVFAKNFLSQFLMDCV